MRSRVVSGVGWAGFSQIAVQLTRMLVAVAVARLLSPSDYGLAALTFVFSSLGLIFSDLALGAALVQRKTLTESDRSTAFWTTVASGLLLTGAGLALAAPMAALYGQPRTEPLFAALSVTFIINALGATQQALMLRDMEFRRLELLSIGGALAGAPVAVGLAAAGTGPWAIIGQQIAASAVTSALLWRASSWRPRLRFSRASLRDMWSFSGYLVGHRLLFYTYKNADNFLIGRYVGSAAVGAYAVAYNVMIAPASRIGGPLQRVLAPAFSKMQDEPARIADAWARVTRMIAAVSVPALAGVIVVAPDLIRVLLGTQWSAAAPVLQVLAWVGIIQALQSINLDILMARGRTRLMFRFMVVFVVVHVTSFAIGVQYGVMGVAVAHALSSTLVEPFLTVLTARVLGVSPWMFFRALSGVFQAAVVMLGVLAAARPALVEAGVPAGGRLAALVALGALVYLPLCAWRAPEVVEDGRALLPRRRRARGDVAVAPAAGG